jgi:Holliday junction resolvase RusA-like endonuclease
MISLDLFGDPIAWKRPQFCRRGKFMHSYDGQEKLKLGYKWQIKSLYREEPLTQPVSLDLTFFMPVPESTSAIKKRQMLNGVCYHMKRPDLDNLQKFILDCLSSIVLHDDAQIVEIRARKIYSTKPGTLVRITPVAQQRSDILDSHETYTRNS